MSTKIYNKNIYILGGDNGKVLSNFIKINW